MRRATNKYEARTTHYERVLSRVKDLSECKRWAKVAVNTENPTKGFMNLVQQQVKTTLSSEKSQQMVKHFTTESVGYMHALTLEWVRKHSDGYYALTKDTPAFADFLGRLTGRDQASINVGGQMAYQMACHELAGKRVYALTERLSELLLHTELQGLTTDDLQLPERSIYIQVPTSTPLQVYNEDTGGHALEGVYITEDARSEVSHRCWRFLAVGIEKGEKLDYCANDAIAYWRVDLPEGAKLDQIIQQANTQMRVDTLKYDSPFAKMWSEWDKIFKFGMNAVIYATWPDCKRENIMANKEARKLWERVQRHPPKSSKRSKAQQAFQRLIPMRRIILDRTTSRSSGDKGTTSGQPLIKRVRVHGHWKRQAMGRGRAQRKLIWIEPHWRGPIDGEQTESTHRLK